MCGFIVFCNVKTKIIYILYWLVKFEYVLFYQFYAKITTFFRSRKVRIGFSLIRLRRNVWRQLTWKRRQDVKNDGKTLKSPYWLHALELSYTPSCKTTFPNSGFTEMQIGYARKENDTSVLCTMSDLIIKYWQSVKEFSCELVSCRCCLFSNILLYFEKVLKTGEIYLFRGYVALMHSYFLHIDKNCIWPIVLYG